MALQTSGPISLSDIQTEFGGTNPISLSEYYRGGGLVPSGAPQNANIAASGAIAMGGFYGAVRAFVFNQTISTNTSNYNLRSAAIAAGWDTTTPLQASITINTGVFVSATNTGVYAFDTGESFPSGSTLSLVNNGTIVGMGGAGGAGAGGVGGGGVTAYVGTAGSSGGPAFIARHLISVTNSGTIAGGGGGGGGGQTVWGWYGDSKAPTYYTYGGGGGGGGRGGATNSTGGNGGYGDNGSGNPGGPGTVSGPGGGGIPGLVSAPQAGYGGNGGGWGAAGNSGGTRANPSLTAFAGPYSGGAGGAAVSGNSNISWVTTGTRLGTIA